MSAMDSFRKDKTGTTLIGMAILMCILGFARLYAIDDDGEAQGAESTVETPLLEKSRDEK